MSDCDDSPFREYQKPYPEVTCVRTGAKDTMNEQGTRDYKGKPPRHYFYDSIGLVLHNLNNRSYFHYIQALEEYLRDEQDGDAEGILYEMLQLIQTAHPRILANVSYVTKMGAQKYGHANYKKGMDFSLCISSFVGHMLDLDAGIELDDESGRPHIEHMTANLLILLYYVHNYHKLYSKFNDIPAMFKEPEKK